MPLTKDEQSIKNDSEFLKLDRDVNSLQLVSNSYIVSTHYLNNESRSVICRGRDNCLYCKSKVSPRKEFHYIALVNKQEGKINLPAKVFFDMNKIESMTKKDKRNYSWIVIKEGEGREVRYTTSKDKTIKMNPEKIEENNKKLEDLMSFYETNLEDNYKRYAHSYSIAAKNSSMQSDSEPDDIDPEVGF